MHYGDKQTAINAAVKLSIEKGYAAIIQTGSERWNNDEYCIELEPPFIRVNERLFAEYENGKQINKD